MSDEPRDSQEYDIVEKDEAKDLKVEGANEDEASPPSSQAHEDTQKAALDPNADKTAVGAKDADAKATPNSQESLPVRNKENLAGTANESSGAVEPGLFAPVEMLNRIRALLTMPDDESATEENMTRSQLLSTLPRTMRGYRPKSPSELPFDNKTTLGQMGNILFEGPDMENSGDPFQTIENAGRAVVSAVDGTGKLQMSPYYIDSSSPSSSSSRVPGYCGPSTCKTFFPFPILLGCLRD